MNRYPLIIALFSGALFLAGYFSQVQAATNESKTDDSDVGFYLGLSAGYGDPNWDDNILPIDTENFSTRGTLGYQFTKYFTKELGFTYFFQANDIETWTLDFSSRLIIPVWENISLFGKWGINYMKTNFSHAGSRDNFNSTFGAGVMYDFGNNFVAEVSWQRFGGDQDINDFQPFADYFSVGIIYQLSSWFSN